MTEIMTDGQTTTLLRGLKEPGGTTVAMAQIKMVSIFLVRMMIGVHFSYMFLGLKYIEMKMELQE